jgi:2-amino-4-hydroxy-6-hydroxymethyldihydropteridine diphosphokinase
VAGPVRVAVALGSNIEPRREHLDYGVGRLTALLADLRVSSYFETEPVGVRPQPRFLNAAAVGTTGLSAAELLEQLLHIEEARGRARPHQGAPRTLDLDLILYGDQIVSTPDLSVPHPRFRDRQFVLEPLAEIAGDMTDPVTKRSIQELLKSLIADR